MISDMCSKHRAVASVLLYSDANAVSSASRGHKTSMESATKGLSKRPLSPLDLMVVCATFITVHITLSMVEQTQPMRHPCVKLRNCSKVTEETISSVYKYILQFLTNSDCGSSSPPLRWLRQFLQRYVGIKRHFSHST